MDKDIERILRMFQRIKVSPDGLEFIEYLSELSADNYKAFKKAHIDSNEVHKGYALCIDNLITLFEQCDIKLKENNVIVSDWTS